MKLGLSIRRGLGELGTRARALRPQPDAPADGTKSSPPPAPEPTAAPTPEAVPVPSEPPPAPEPTPEAVPVPSEPLTSGLPRQGRSSLSAIFGLISGFLLGAGSFYTAFFRGALQTTAVLIDLLVVSLLISAGYQLWTRHRYLTVRNMGLRHGSWLLVGLAMIAVVSYIGFQPPNVKKVPPTEACRYDVQSQTPIPLVPGGSIQQTFQVDADEIRAISVIPGLDARATDITGKYPLRIRFRVPSEDIDAFLGPENAVNNGYTRFNFPKPVHVPERTRLSVQVINESHAIVAIYIKRPDPIDIIDTDSLGVFITGHAEQEKPYTFTGSFLSGCVATN